MILFTVIYHQLNDLNMSFELPDLPYANDALEPHIDSRTI